MAVDVGLKSGICSLWQQQTLCDYIIEVEDKEIAVHKIIMASVSDYFRVMLSGSMLESSSDRVKLQGQSAAAVSKLIELVYTADSNIVKDNALDILEPAVYFQMTKIIESCKKIIQKSLNEKNCLELLAVFIKYSFREEVEKVKKFLISKFSAAFEHYSPESTSYEVLQIIIDCWRKREWDLFELLKHWVNVDYENRNVYLNALMSQVRFGLMTPHEAEVATRMEVYRNSEGDWRELVDQAVKYQTLPMYQKVLEESVQTKVRENPSLFVFSSGYVSGKNLFLSLDEKDCWRTCVYPESGFTDEVFQDTIVVNNFLIAQTNSDEQEEQVERWCIFDPRTITWSEIASISRPKTMFSLVANGGYLYALGGYLKDLSQVGNSEFILINEVERYNFQDNTWNVTGNMPVPVAYSSACVFANHVYCSGGSSYGCTLRRMDRMNLDTLEWERRAPMITPKSSHRMAVMKIGNEDVIITFQRKSLDLEMYSPATDNWYRFNVPTSCISDLYRRGFCTNMPVITGNTIFLLTLPDDCLKWTLTASGEKPSQVSFKGVSVPDGWEEAELKAALLAVPSHVFLESILYT